MKIGVVSDTHNHMRNVLEIVRLFNEAKVDHVVHTGDITTAKTLELFADLNAPFSGVFGNNDVEIASLKHIAARNEFQFRQPPLFLNFGARRVVVVHDPRDLTETLIQDTDVALHGHTHLLRMERQDGLTIFNPGECAGHMKGLNAVGVIELESYQMRLLKF
ncbi:MAG: YfcE family phosphodiesterase [Gammaproteobacteria bacterium]|nr:YfcE family phosphodiesterase [Gammaproteobacteria bacterium]